MRSGGGPRHVSCTLSVVESQRLSEPAAPRGSPRGRRGEDLPPSRICFAGKKRLDVRVRFFQQAGRVFGARVRCDFEIDLYEECMLTTMTRWEVIICEPDSTMLEQKCRLETQKRQASKQQMFCVDDLDVMMMVFQDPP